MLTSVQHLLDALAMTTILGGHWTRLMGGLTKAALFGMAIGGVISIGLADEPSNVVSEFIGLPSDPKWRSETPYGHDVQSLKLEEQSNTPSSAKPKWQPGRLLRGPDGLTILDPDPEPREFRVCPLNSRM